MTMQQHFRFLGWLLLAFGIIGLVSIVAAAILLMLYYWGVVSIVGLALANEPEFGSVSMSPIEALKSVSGFWLFFMLGIVSSVLYVIAGAGLLKQRQWARSFTIAASILSLPGAPFWTALGIYGLWLMYNADSTTSWAEYVG